MCLRHLVSAIVLRFFAVSAIFSAVATPAAHGAFTEVEVDGRTTSSFSVDAGPVMSGHIFTSPIPGSLLEGERSHFVAITEGFNERASVYQIDGGPITV